MSHKCPKCKFRLLLNEKFCPECGTKSPFYDPYKFQEKICPACKKKINSKSQFCGRCGYCFYPDTIYKRNKQLIKAAVYNNYNIVELYKHKRIITPVSEKKEVCAKFIFLIICYMLFLMIFMAGMFAFYHLALPDNNDNNTYTTAFIYLLHNSWMLP